MFVLTVTTLFVVIAIGAAIWLYRRFKRIQKLSHAQAVAAHKAAITPAAWAAAGWWSNILTDILKNTEPGRDEGRRSLSEASIDLFRQTLAAHIVDAYVKSTNVFHDPRVTVDGNFDDGALIAAGEAAGIVGLSSLLPRMSLVEVRPGKLKIMREPGVWVTSPVR